MTRPDGKPIQVVIADDETMLADLLRFAVTSEGWQPHTASDGQRALKLIREVSPDVVVLDVMMPQVDGVEVVRRVRTGGNEVPILLLTAKDEVSDRIAGLSAGADDYVTKPFSVEEVVIRLRGLVRRHLRALEADEALLVVGDLQLNDETHEVMRAGVRIELTATEFALLRYLMENPRTVLSKAQILDRVWGYDFGGRSSVVELYISYLRKKIDSVGEPMIHTLRGVGYTIRAADA